MLLLPMQVVAVEDGEANADEGDLKLLALVQGVSLNELPIRVADHEVRLVSEYQ